MAFWSSPPPPGWYDDPEPGASGLRWWDGARWTTHCRRRVPEGPSRKTPVAEAEGQTSIPARAFWWAIGGLLAGEVVGALLAGIAASVTGSSTGAAVTLVGEMGLWGGMLASCVLVTRTYGTGSLRRDLGLRIRPTDVWTGFGVAVAGTVLSFVYGSIFAHTRFAGTNTGIITGQRHNGVGFVVVTLVVAVGAPFFEELFFRGLIRTALQSRFGPVPAVVIQGLVFGLVHFQAGTGFGNVSVIVTVASLGIILGFTALRTGRLGAGMIGHGGFNLITTLIVLAS